MGNMFDHQSRTNRIRVWLENSSGQTIQLDIVRATQGLLVLYLVAVMAMVLGSVLPALVRVPIVVVALTFVPGGLAVLLLTDGPTIDAMRLLYAYGLSLMILMFIGVVTNLALPVLGIERPLTPLPLAIVVTLTVSILAAAVFQRRQRGTVEIHLPHLFEPAPLGLLVLPLGAILGVSLVNTTGNNDLILVVLCVIAVMPLIVIRRVRTEWYTLGIWTIALAILYHKSLWAYAGFSGRPHGIKAWEAGRWSPGIAEVHPYTSELLPNGVLFPLYAHLSDVFILTQYEVVNPLLVSFIPVAIFVAVRRFVDPDTAFLAAALFAFAHPFYLQYPTAGRAASPVIFLSLFGVVLVDSEHRPAVRSIFAVLFLSGIVVSHYGTSYYVMFAIFLALGVLFVLRQVNTFLGTRGGAVVDGGVKVPGKRVVGLNRRTSILSTSLVLYFASATLTWYLYMRQGSKFKLLPRFVVENIETLISGTMASGRTAARIQKDYGASSIRMAKYIYVTIGILMAIGFVVILYHQIIKKVTSPRLDNYSDRLPSFDSYFDRLPSFDSRRLSKIGSPLPRNEMEVAIDDQYLVVAGSVFAIFWTTIVFKNWGGGRPMMITFVFTTSFAVIGMIWMTNRARGYGGREAFSVLLAALFLLNSGVGAATVLPGNAPNNVPRHAQLASSDSPTDQLAVHRDTDIETHLWLIKHHGGYQVYADTFGARQYDWYRPLFAAKTEKIDMGYSVEHKPEGFDPRTERLGTSYILVLGHNEELGTFWPARFGSGVPLGDLGLSTHNKIYTNGESSIYYSSSVSNTSADGPGTD